MATKSTTATSQAKAGKIVNVKLVLLGESAVGKSSMALRFNENKFNENSEPTIGGNFFESKSI